MLDLALQAGLPLIKITTEDTVNVYRVLSHITDGETFVEIEESHISKLESPGFSKGTRFFYLIEPSDNLKYPDLYDSLVDTERTLVIINPDHDDPAVFDAGEVRVPTDLLEQFLTDMVLEEDIEKFVAVLSGLTLKDVGEICRLTMTKHGDLTPRGVTDIRRQYVGRQRGVDQVDTRYNFYDPPKFLTEWLKLDGQLFKQHNIPREVVPRGLLFGGMPGTGKTMGAKYLANELGVPLYRMDLGGLMGKYVGESETNLANALSVVDNSEPCILLLDEIEKIFTGGEDTGVSKRLLSALLWWLQEHQSRVFTILTTNDSESLPKELYRPGRIDREHKFQGIKNPNEQSAFMAAVVESLDIGLNGQEMAHKITQNLKKHPKERSQAELTQFIYLEVKKALI